MPAPGPGDVRRARRTLVLLTVLRQVPTGLVLTTWLLTADARGLDPVVHERVDGARRATLLSVRSLVANVSVAGGALLLGAVGQQAGTGWAFAVAGLVTALAALPLLGVARARAGALAVRR